MEAGGCEYREILIGHGNPQLAHCPVCNSGPEGLDRKPRPPLDKDPVHHDVVGERNCPVVVSHFLTVPLSIVGGFRCQGVTRRSSESNKGGRMSLLLGSNFGATSERLLFLDDLCK